MMKIKFWLPIFLTLSILSGSLLWGQTVADRSGFCRIDPVRYYFHNGSYYARIHHTTAAARMWYTFLKADTGAGNKPLFVFFNGGPGSGTTCGLMGFYTGRKTLDNRIMGGGDKYIDNPFSWTALGNLLYIDARCTGFSYAVLDPGKNRDLGTLSQEFTGRNFNSYIDAADYVRVLLKLLKDRPSIQRNPVIIVGESYGGVRATLMLHMLLNYKGYGDGSDIFQDPDLVDRVQEHYDTVFPQYLGQTVPPQVIARQFGKQILIQPAIDSYQRDEEINLLEQEDSVIYEIAEEVNQTFEPCTSGDCDRLGAIYEFIRVTAGRDPYGCHKEDGWTDSFFVRGSELVVDSKHLAEVTGFDVKNVPDMYASARARGYKYFWYGSDDTRLSNALSPPDRDLSFMSDKDRYLWELGLERRSSRSENETFTDFPSIFGELQPWDAFYLQLNYDSNYSYHYFTASVIRQYRSNSYNELTGRKFLQNLVHVDTFITNAKYDIVVYTNALPVGLGHHTDVVRESLHLKNQPSSAERPGLIRVSYVDGAFDLPGNIGARTIRFPFYTNSSHPVSLTEPGEFYNDVKAWLNR